MDDQDFFGFGGDEGPPMGHGPGFRGRGGGGWRGGRGGPRFDGGFGPRGPPPRFRGGPRGFGPPGMRGGPPQGPGGPRFRGGPPGGHFERFPPRFGGGGGGGGWGGPPPFHGPDGGEGGGGPNYQGMMGGGGPGPGQDHENIWAEAKTETGTLYYYNTKTRVTSWDRPEGPNIKVMSHDEFAAAAKSGKLGDMGSRPADSQQIHQSPGAPFSNSPSGLGGDGFPHDVQQNDKKESMPSMVATGVPPVGQPVQPVPGPVPGFPSFSSAPPPFGLQFQNFPMVPPPWGMTGAPPSLGPAADPLIQHVDPIIAAKALDWTEHVAPDGKRYYFNTKSQTSVWDKPMALIEFDTAKVIAQQRLNQQAIIAANAKEKLAEKNEKQGDKDGDGKKMVFSGDKCKPVSSTPVTGTPWCVVWTGDKRVFFYNPSTKSSVWERPPDLLGRMDVEELLRTCPAAAKPPPAGPVKKAEATSTSENSQNANPLSPPSEAEMAAKAEKRPASAKPAENGSEEPPEKKLKSEVEKEESPPSETVPKGPIVVTLDDDQEKKTDFREANTLELEVKAAKERATVPLEIRQKQFTEMLIEKQVSAFSTWEKELHKIVFDPRYLLLTSKERKAAFDDYVKERAIEERKEKKARLAQVKENFIKFLDDIRVHQKMSYNEFSQRYSRDERYRSVEKSRDRESYFQEYISELKKKDRDVRRQEKDKVKQEFLDALKESVIDYHLRWEEARKFVDGSKFAVLDSEDKEDLFRTFQKRLKSEVKSKAKKQKKTKKHRKDSEKSVKDKDPKDPPTEQQDQDREEGETPDSEEDDKEKDNASEEDEGMVSDDSEDENRIKKEKAENSIREREKEVQKALATHLRDRDKERDYYRHEEAVQELQGMLADLIRISDISWKDAKKALKKDRRWDSAMSLSREEMEEVFNQHCENIEKKKKTRFRELLKESRVKLNSSWKDVRRKIKEDPRCQKYSSDDRKCEREFAAYLKDLASSMKSDFRVLLKETKMLTYKTKQHVRENPQVMREIEMVLEKDKRFLNLETMPEVRRRLLVDYLEEIEQKGPPPPPTASDKVSRRLK